MSNREDSKNSAEKYVPLLPAKPGTVCDAYTKQGMPCPHRAKLIHQETGHAVCRKHLPMCRRLYKDYKEVCNQVWSEKCLRGMSNTELFNIMEQAEVCRSYRVMFQNQCCDGIDRGHKGAIDKMEKISNACARELSHRR